MGLLINAWQEIVSAIEDDFREGRLTDDETKLRLRPLFDVETAELMWRRLYSARKHNNWRE